MLDFFKKELGRIARNYKRRILRNATRSVEEKIYEQFGENAPKRGRSTRSNSSYRRRSSSSRSRTSSSSRSSRSSDYRHEDYREDTQYRNDDLNQPYDLNDTGYGESKRSRTKKTSSSGTKRRSGSTNYDSSTANGNSGSETRSSTSAPNYSETVNNIPGLRLSVPVNWDFAAEGMPNFAYKPDFDNAPDPGEVVWTWVPFEEDPTQGKDRPVLVVALDGNNAVFAPLTSKDHANEGLYEDQYGRWWFDIGTGDWDEQGRPSEIRLDLLWKVDEAQIRRTGGVLNSAIFDQVVQQIREINR
ncbi:MAG: type II toxin-antitoxin system PemK/MazF family toxin [Arcanobacterium sp.]|nr:type II toxin-antitoxin system PemK/MazF family toxin [Arcanobacterium sp.]